jgi:uncharacterized protein (TIGR02594 family)
VRITAFGQANKQIGLREYPAGETNPHILAWLADAGIPNAQDEVPWCGAFVGHIVWRHCGLPVPRNYARARSWLKVGTPIPIESAMAAWDVVVLRRGEEGDPGPDVYSGPGHVGFFAGLEGLVHRRVLVLGGNQGDEVSIAPFPEGRVLGVRRLHAEDGP